MPQSLELTSGEAMGWATWAKSRRPQVQGPPVPGKKISVTVPMRTSGYETLECFIATLPT